MISAKASHDANFVFDSKSFLKNITTRPGIYQMFNQVGDIIYVGKARNLKKRLSHYFQKQAMPPKTLALVSQIAHVEVIVTETEQEALILEYNLIKKYRPRYNIIFRDDKSYTYIVLTDHSYPRLMRQYGRHGAPRVNTWSLELPGFVPLHGTTPWLSAIQSGATSRRSSSRIHSRTKAQTFAKADKIKGHCFGPYPQSTVVRAVIDFLQKFFKLRNCNDTFFRSRSRPCLQYQIKRCTAPCVKYISEKEYAEDVKHALLFLSGQSDQLIKTLENQMENASKNRQYEIASKYRDQIVGLREIQSKQHVAVKKGEVDVVVVEVKEDQICIYLLMIRQGNVLGNKTFFAKLATESTEAELLSNFIMQHYLNEAAELPKEILLPIKIKEDELLENTLSETVHHSVKIKFPKRGVAKKWIEMAQLSAKEALQSRLLKTASMHQQFLALKQALNLEHMPKHIECFDISHTMGEATIASCVVFNQEGASTSDYRRFNISNIKPGDDVAAMYQALKRRFLKAKENSGKLADLIIIDGGKTQLRQAEKVLQELEMTGVKLISVAKGAGRKPGLEKIFLSSQSAPLFLPPDSPALHLIQLIRDEAHRFAISGHRKRREKSRRRSVLENIEGVGAARRAMLLKHFGGLQGVVKASKDEISKVHGINHELAQRIYDVLH